MRCGFLFLLIFAILTACRGAADKRQSEPGPAGERLWLPANGLRIKAQIYKSVKLTDHPVLVVVLHGDLLEANEFPYHYLFARRAAQRLDNVIAAALLRPGYADDNGDRSSGSRGLATGDNYTPEVVDAIGGAIRQLQLQFHPASSILAGHSGGAAITADILGRQPPVNGALIVSCPCNLPLWRKGMARTRLTSIGPLSLLFLLPVQSLSPIDLVSGIPPGIRVSLVVGSRDPITPLKLSLEYARALQKHGTGVNLTIVPGLGHNILLEPVVFEQLKTLIEH